MYQFIAQEAEHSQLLLELVQLQVQYHRTSLEALEEVVPLLLEEKGTVFICPYAVLFKYGSQLLNNIVNCNWNCDL